VILSQILCDGELIQWKTYIIEFKQLNKAHAIFLGLPLLGQKLGETKQGRYIPEFGFHIENLIVFSINGIRIIFDWFAIFNLRRILKANYIKMR